MSRVSRWMLAARSRCFSSSSSISAHNPLHECVLMSRNSSSTDLLAPRFPASELDHLSQDLNAFLRTVAPRSYAFHPFRIADFCIQSFVPSPSWQGIIGAQDLTIMADSVKRKRKKKMNKHKHRKLRRRVRKSGK